MINFVTFICFIFDFRKMSIENITSTLLYNESTIVPAKTFRSTVEAFQIAAPSAVLIDRIITPVWYTIGVIGHPITMKVWLSKRMRESNSSAIYLGSIAIVQFVFIILHFLLELHLAWDIPTYNKPTICEIFNFLYITPQYLSPLLIFGFTVERYIAVCHPFRKEMYCTVRRAIIVVAVLTALSLCLGSLQAYIWTYNERRNLCFYRPGAKPFYEVWTWVTEVLIFALVPLFVLVFNIFVIREIKRLTRRASFRMYKDSQRQNTFNQTSTVTLLSVSFYLICTLLPATIVYTLQSLIPTGDHKLPPKDWPNDPQWQKYLTYYVIRKIVEEICFSNYACYIFIYYITGSYFRNEVHKIICFKSRKTKNSRDKKKPGRSRPSKTSTTNACTNQYTLITTNGKPEVEINSTIC